MAESGNRYTAPDRDLDDELTSGKGDEAITGRADEEDDEEFEDTEDLDEEEDLDESDR